MANQVNPFPDLMPTVSLLVLIEIGGSTVWNMWYMAWVGDSVST